MIRFDPTNPAHKSPVGGAPAGDLVRLKPRISRRLGAFAVDLCGWRDGDPAPCTGAHPAICLPMQWQGQQDYYDTWAVAFTAPEPGLYWYAFCLHIEGERRYIGVDGGLEPFQLLCYDPAFNTPDWLPGGVIYHVFVDRFARDSDTPLPPHAIARDWGDTPIYAPNELGIVENRDFWGGNLPGITAKLPYLQSLGVTLLYLSPIFKASSNHKYDTGDYLQIDPSFGTREDFRQLIKQAKADGMRVMLDGVFNHTGSDAPYFQAAAADKNSPYYPWYTFRTWPDDYECWWDVRILPAIAKHRTGFWDLIAGEGGVLDTWMDEGVAAWRLDVADELADDFLAAIRARVRAKDPQGLVLGEVWEDASNKISYDRRRPYLQGGQLDSVMNYPLRDAIIHALYIADPTPIAKCMETLADHYPPQVLHSLMNLLGTHDTPRILTELGDGALHGHPKHEQANARLTPEQHAEGKAKLMLAATLAYTLPGVPSVYYGDEAGMQGCADPFNRRGYPWGHEDQVLLTHYRHLSRLRAHPALAKGDYKTTYCQNGLYAFTRTCDQGELMVVANLAPEAKKFALPKGKALLGIAQKELPPWGIVCLELP